MGYATQAIRHILVDYGRRRNALRRGGGQVQSLDSQELARMAPADAKHEEALVVANLLDRLHSVNSRAAQVAEMRYFSEMEHEAIGRLLGMSDRTVRKHWKAAKAWLAAEMADEPELASFDR